MLRDGMLQLDVVVDLAEEALDGTPPRRVPPVPLRRRQLARVHGEKDRVQ